MRDQMCKAEGPTIADLISALCQRLIRRDRTLEVARFAAGAGSDAPSQIAIASRQSGSLAE